MFGDGALTFREFMMQESLPLATIHPERPTQGWF